MARDATTEGPAWDALREALEAMRAIAQAPRASHVELGKAFARLADAMLETTLAAGQTSMRYRAVRRALDLRTPKRALAAFLEEG